MHAAMRAECVLGHGGAKRVDGQRVPSPQELEIAWSNGEVKNPLLSANAAIALRQQIQVDPGPEPYAAAMASTFTLFQHLRTPNQIRLAAQFRLS
jgi:hypothetical protein